MAATAIVTYAILVLGGSSFRRIEVAIGAFVAVIGICYLIEVFIAPVNWGAAVHGMLTPQIADSGALTLAVGIVGATVMPHAIYLHSSLTQSRTVLLSDTQRARVPAVFQPGSDRRAERRRRHQYGDGDYGRRGV